MFELGTNDTSHGFVHVLEFRTCHQGVGINQGENCRTTIALSLAIFHCSRALQTCLAADRESGLEGIKAFLQPKTVNINMKMPGH